MILGGYDQNEKESNECLKFSIIDHNEFLISEIKNQLPVAEAFSCPNAYIFNKSLFAL